MSTVFRGNGKKVYIAGPMAGVKDFNFPMFFKVEKWLKSWGFEVSNPAGKQCNKDEKPDLEKTPVTWGGTDTRRTAGEVFKQDFMDIMDGEAIVLLPGWVGSSGALVEFEVARLCQKERYQLVINKAGEFDLEKLPEWLVCEMTPVHKAARRVQSPLPH
jgi:hypothetical protein